MIVAVLLALLIIGCFAGVLLVGAPYLPTLSPQIATALKLADVHAGDTMLELGCGDGKVLVAAARQGVYVVGYELNPFLVMIAWLRTRKYRQNVRIIWGDFWRTPWPQADAIFVFLLPKYMEKLDKKIVQYSKKPVKLVSFAFAVPNKHPAATQDGVLLYVYK